MARFKTFQQTELAAVDRNVFYIPCFETNKHVLQLKNQLTPRGKEVSMAVQGEWWNKKSGVQLQKIHIYFQTGVFLSLNFCRIKATCWDQNRPVNRVSNNLPIFKGMPLTETSQKALLLSYQDTE